LADYTGDNFAHKHSSVSITSHLKLYQVAMILPF
jgi:hypothetical protein